MTLTAALRISNHDPAVVSNIEHTVKSRGVDVGVATRSEKVERMLVQIEHLGYLVVR